MMLKNKMWVQDTTIAFPAEIVEPEIPMIVKGVAIGGVILGLLYLTRKKWQT